MKKEKRIEKRFTSGVLFLVYLLVLVYFLFFSEQLGRVEASEYHYNLVPFKEIKRFLYYRDQIGMEYFMLNLVGNVLAFIPFGFFIPRLSESMRGILYTTMCTFVFSLIVECAQLYFKVGTFDVDDLMLNTFGGVLGFLIFGIWYLIFGRKKTKKKCKK